MANIELRFRGHRVEAAVGVGGWTITDPTSPPGTPGGGEIPWRVLLVAPDLGDVPVVLVEPADVRSLADSLNPGVEIPEELRDKLEELLRLQGPPLERGRAGRESDEALVEAHRSLRDEYNQLGRDEGLDLDSDDLFLLARERELFDSLVLFDQPVTVAVAVTRYLPNVQQAANNQNYVPSGCNWFGYSVLYEVTPPSRTELLWGSGLRNNLRSLPFVVRAATTT